ALAEDPGVGYDHPRLDPLTVEVLEEIVEAPAGAPSPNTRGQKEDAALAHRAEGTRSARRATGAQGVPKRPHGPPRRRGSIRVRDSREASVAAVEDPLARRSIALFGRLRFEPSAPDARPVSGHERR